MSWAEKLGKFHLLYLTLLPAVGSFVLFYLLQTAIHPLLFFLLGTAGIGIYGAFISSYTPITKNACKNLFMLLDGPFWMLISPYFGTSLAQAIVNDVIGEMASVLLGILGIILASSIPTPHERRNAALAVGLPFLGIVFLFLTYSVEQNFSLPQKLILALAVLQGASTHFFTGFHMKQRKDTEDFILIGIIAWLISFCVIGPFFVLILQKI